LLHTIVRPFLCFPAGRRQKYRLVLKTLMDV
jgi:hypothetical protein